MNCDACQSKLTSWMLSECDAATSAAIEQHLSSGCTICAAHQQQMMASLETLVDGMTLVSPERPTWPAVESAIHPHAVVAAPTRGPSRWIRAAILLVAVAGGFAVAGPILSRWGGVHPQADLASTTPSSPPALDDRSGGDVNRVSMRTRVGDFGSGAMVLDPIAKQVHLQLRSPPADCSYSLWWVTTDDEWISAGDLSPLGSGHFGGVFDLPTMPTLAAIKHAVVLCDAAGLEPMAASLRFAADPDHSFWSDPIAWL